MLLQEAGSLDPETIGDYGYSLGISQHHICYRGFRGKKYCNTAAKVDFYDKYDWFRRDVWAQFNHYSDAVRKLIVKGYTARQIVISWNSNEPRRYEKVMRWAKFVELSIK